MNQVATELFTIDGKEICTDYVRIENRDQFLVNIPSLPPNDPRYIRFWSKVIKYCVDGKWGKMFGGYRYMRGPTYLYGNFFLIQHTDERKVTSYILPRIDDIEWEISYGIGVARGFSGFEKDEDFTCLHVVKEYEEANVSRAPSYILERFPSAIKKDGTLKKYVDPLEYIRKLHPRPLGRALYENETKNHIILGSRGGGKSYYVAGEVFHGILFDGLNEYSEKLLNEQAVAEFCIGSGNADKSSELVGKIKFAVEALASPEHGRRFGVWGDPTDPKSDYTPCPLYRDFIGTYNVGNKKNPLRHRYKVDAAGRWIWRGTGTKLFHVCYSRNKGDGAQAGTGGRYLISVVEEVGETDNIKEVHASNDTTVAREGVRFGTEIYIGTSGNLFLVQAAKEMFLNPQDYDILPYSNRYGTEGKDGKIGFFLPFYLTLRQYKDKNGNTDFRRAVEHINKIRTKKKKSSSVEVFRKEKMNRPCFVEEMFLSLEGDIMPVEELRRRERELLSYNTYESLMTPVKLIWDNNHPYGVKYEIDHEGEPFMDYPVNKEKRKRPNGCPVIYDPPRYINGRIPDDMYFIGHDPYVEENLDGGGSLGSTYILMNPKYIGNGLPGNIIVAEYVDKPDKGLEAYYNTQEKLIALYGNPPQGLCYEKNRGADCRGYYFSKNKAFLLKPSPQHAQGSNIFQRNITSYGYTVGNKVSKMQLAIQIKDWLLEETDLTQDGKKRNLDRIPSLYLIRQLLAYNLDDNFDGVDGFRGCVVAYNDYRIRTLAGQEEQKKRQESHILSAYVNNPVIFNNRNRRRSLR